MSLLSIAGGEGRGLATRLGGFTEFANQQVALDSDVSSKNAAARRAELMAERERREAFAKAQEESASAIAELTDISANVDPSQMANANAPIMQIIQELQQGMSDPRVAQAWMKQYIPGAIITMDDARIISQIRDRAAEAEQIRVEAENQAAIMNTYRENILKGTVNDPTGTVDAYYRGDASLTRGGAVMPLTNVDMDRIMAALQKRVEDTAAESGDYYYDGGAFVNRQTQRSDPTFVKNIVLQYLLDDIQTLNQLEGRMVSDVESQQVAAKHAERLAQTLRFDRETTRADESAATRARANVESQQIVTPLSSTLINPGSQPAISLTPTQQLDLSQSAQNFGGPFGNLFQGVLGMSQATPQTYLPGSYSSTPSAGFSVAPTTRRQFVGTIPREFYVVNPNGELSQELLSNATRNNTANFTNGGIEIREYVNDNGSIRPATAAEVAAGRYNGLMAFDKLAMQVSEQTTTSSRNIGRTGVSTTNTRTPGEQVAVLVPYSGINGPIPLDQLQYIDRYNRNLEASRQQSNPQQSNQSTSQRTRGLVESFNP